MHNFTRTCLALGLLLSLVSCASISVDKTSQRDTADMPKKVYVELFDASRGEFKVDREGAELNKFKSSLQAMMQTGITTDLTRRLIPAVAASKNGQLPQEKAWLIRGEFVRVNQGSRLLRGTIGFGAGGTKLVTKVSIYNLNEPNSPPFLTFDTTGGSGAEPGGVTGLATDPLIMAIGTVASAGGGIAHGVTEDTARTAREITAQLSDYMYQHSWITEDMWIKPKKLDRD